MNVCWAPNYIEHFEGVRCVTEVDGKLYRRHINVLCLLTLQIGSRLLELHYVRCFGQQILERSSRADVLNCQVRNTVEVLVVRESKSGVSERRDQLFASSV